VGIHEGCGVSGEISDEVISFDASWAVLLSYETVMKAYRKQHMLF
jgi:hypothetical protein